MKESQVNRDRAHADHDILVSIDGLRAEFCQNERWPAPTLQQFAWEGTFAREMRSVFPALTYPAHTTSVTGARPARHGVCHNRPCVAPLVAALLGIQFDALDGVLLPGLLEDGMP